MLAALWFDGMIVSGINRATRNLGPRHAQRRAESACGQVVAIVPLLRAEADFIDERFVTKWFALRGEETEDFGGSAGVGKELDKCVLECQSFGRYLQRRAFGYGG